MLEDLPDRWQELLAFVQGKRIVGVAIADDEADFDLIFEDGSRLELYALEEVDEDGNRYPFIGWALDEGDESEVEWSGNGRAGDD